MSSYTLPKDAVLVDQDASASLYTVTENEKLKEVWMVVNGRAFPVDPQLRPVLTHGYGLPQPLTILNARAAQLGVTGPEYQQYLDDIKDIDEARRQDRLSYLADMLSSTLVAPIFQKPRKDCTPLERDIIDAIEYAFLLGREY